MSKIKDMAYGPIEDLLDKVPSIYKLVIVASKRAFELNDGKERLIDISPLAKPTTVALEEIREGKVAWQGEGQGEKK